MFVLLQIGSLESEAGTWKAGVDVAVPGGSIRSGVIRDVPQTPRLRPKIILEAPRQIVERRRTAK
jgi:hypothetical protein